MRLGALLPGRLGAIASSNKREALTRRGKSKNLGAHIGLGGIHPQHIGGGLSTPPVTVGVPFPGGRSVGRRLPMY